MDRGHQPKCGDQRLALEAEIHATFQQGNIRLAAARALQLYNDDLTGWLVRRFRCRQEVVDAYSDFTYYFWRLFQTFEWRSSLRTWMFSVARRVCYADLRRRHERLSEVPSEISALVAANTTRISTYRLPAVEAAYRELCDRVLNQEELDLLTWRIRCGMQWAEIAEVLADEPIQDDQELRRVASSLRKKFERIKRRLRKAAEERGLTRTSS